MRPLFLALVFLPLTACAGSWTHPTFGPDAIAAARQDCADQGWIRLKNGYDDMVDAAAEIDAPIESYVVAGTIATLHGLGLMLQFNDDCMRRRGFARDAQYR